MPWEPQPQKQTSNIKVQTREGKQGKQEVLITEAEVVGDVYYMRLGKAEPHWEFHACLSHSQPRCTL